MSETEMDDVWRTVLESRTKLNEVRMAYDRRQRCKNITRIECLHMQVKRRFRNCQAGGGGRETFGGDDDLSDANGSENETKANESSSSLSGAGLDTDPDFTNELVSSITKLFVCPIRYDNKLQRQESRP